MRSLRLEFGGSPWDSQVQLLPGFAGITAVKAIHTLEWKSSCEGFTSLRVQSARGGNSVTLKFFFSSRSISDYENALAQCPDID